MFQPKVHLIRTFQLADTISSDKNSGFQLLAEVFLLDFSCLVLDFLT